MQRGEDASRHSHIFIHTDATIGHRLFVLISRLEKHFPPLAGIRVDDGRTRGELSSRGESISHWNSHGSMGHFCWPGLYYFQHHANAIIIIIGNATIGCGRRVFFCFSTECPPFAAQRNPSDVRYFRPSAT
uniref:Uncharacterized protein n=1 Tax=Anopheles atroparvus TaxID=41427 RepID=A0AAG5DQG4_ANOAO